MPAHHQRQRPHRAWPARGLIGSITLALVFTAVPATAAPVAAGVDLTPRITAMRNSQLAYEREMLAGDRMLHGTKKKLKRNYRALRRTKKALVRAKRRRSEARRTVIQSRRALRVARSAGRAAAADSEVPLEVTPWIAPFTSSQDLVAPVPDPLSVVGLPLAVPPLPEPSTPEPSTSSDADLRSLKRELRKDKRELRRAKRVVRKVQRVRQGKKATVRAVKRQRRIGKSRRAAGEAALKGRILAMAPLAERRAKKKTKQRPGINTHFSWPTAGRITQRYGCTGSIYSPRRGSCSGFHDGLDIAAASGTPIRAAGVGVISYVGRNPWDRGKRAFMVVVAHPGGYETLYAHVLPIRKVSVGQLVRRGTVIAYMGSTGHSTGSHLHIEFRRGRTTLDPLRFL